MTEQVLAKGAKRMLVVLTVVNVLNFLDRQLVSILIPHIKADLRLTDSQIGLLSGAAFAIFFSVAGVPLGWLATRVDRRKLIAAAIAAWSVMTALCGSASGFFHLMLARVGVGVGEAGAGPSCYAMISDTFSERSRPAAISFYATASSLGAGGGILFGGWAGEALGWRTAFVMAGALGLLVVPLVWFALVDPLTIQGRLKLDRSSSVTRSIAVIFRTRTFPPLLAAAIFTAFSGYTLMIWLPSFLVRSFHLTTAHTGAILAPVTVIGGVAGTLTGGLLARRLGSIDIRWWMWLPALTLGVAVPCASLAILSYRLDMTAACLLFTIFASYMFAGPLFAAINTIVYAELRPLANSIVLFLQTLVGLSLGPLLTGMASDALLLRFGSDALRYALVVPIIGMVMAVAFYLLAARTLTADASAARAISRS
jgi:predicted MFS family arabinose efflux permease